MNDAEEQLRGDDDRLVKVPEIQRKRIEEKW